MDFARALWLRIETIHAVTYFGEETDQAGRALGLSGFWMGYFGFRAAPLGPVNAAVVESTFFNFAPGFVARWVPEVWDRATPSALLRTRSGAAVATLFRLVPEVAGLAVEVNADLARGVDQAIAAGRPLFASNRQLAPSEDPVAELWRLCTALREHRGDGHVAALTAAGLDGVEANVMIALEQGNDPEDLQRTRGWSAEAWAAAVDRCRARRLVHPGGDLTDAGHALRREIEATTDRLAFSPWSALTDAARNRLLRALTPAAEAISRSGVIRYPNPMGLPALV